MIFIKFKRTCCCIFFLIILVFPQILLAQGNIFGSVSNSDASTPVNGEMSLFGYLEGSDEEIKIDNCVGTGYDNGNWFDNLPNYLTATVGDRFDYFFYNIVNGENYYLNGLIDSGGFQQENVSLSFSDLPEKPTGLSGKGISGPSVELDWDAVPGLTYHIYRRDASSNGSFFRIDDPSGSLSNTGVAEAPYIDNTVDGISTYHYLIIAENSSGELSPHSEYLEQISSTFMCGDATNNGWIDILDVIFIINLKYKDGPRPDYIESVEVNNDGSLNILDIVYLINFKYKDGPAPTCPDYFEYP